MASGRITDSKYFNKLSVNKLEVNNLKVNEEKTIQPSWLFSLIGECTYNASNNELTITNNDKLKLVGFTDRPYRKQTKYENPILELDLLFNRDNNKDSFENDPPNAVLVIGNKQVVYELVHFDVSTSMFTLKVLSNHEEDYNHMEDYMGEFSLFIDNYITYYSTEPGVREYAVAIAKIRIHDLTIQQNIQQNIVNNYMNEIMRHEDEHKRNR